MVASSPSLAAEVVVVAASSSAAGVVAGGALPPYGYDGDVSELLAGVVAVGALPPPLQAVMPRTSAMHSASRPAGILFFMVSSFCLGRSQFLWSRASPTP